MSRFRAIYRLTCPARDVDARARAIAVEQSVEMPLEAIRHAHVLDEVVAQVEDIRPLPGGGHAVTLLLATATTGHEAGQLLNMLFGNTSLQPDVELLDVELPDDLAGALPGPRFGIAGIRAATGARERALTATALKPQGLAAEELARLARTFAVAGIDVIKDDHGLADQRAAPFAARVEACQRAVDEANRATGGHTVYAPSLTGGPRRLLEQARIAREAGCRMVMLAPMIAGLPLLAELAADPDALGLPVLAHPALGGAARIAPPLLLGKLFRWCGADAVIFPNHGGRFTYSPETCRSIAESARGMRDGGARGRADGTDAGGGVEGLAPAGKPFRHRPALPVPAGGMSLERVPEMLEFYGADTMLLIGGGLLAAGEAMLERGRELAAAVRRGA
ncbi:MAG: ribulose 1,5-bisphosphate carboxylase [Betaproteobacteria bacterium]|nr:ribulose 1,5-bisphosphate carboxylase [Betaproteobacteria bacterium]